MDSFEDLRRYVAEQLEGVCPGCYKLSHDDLVQSVTYDFLRMIEDRYGFDWGDDIAEMEDEEFFDLLKEYEI
jgi:hypothetical protein